MAWELIADRLQVDHDLRIVLLIQGRSKADLSAPLGMSLRVLNCAVLTDEVGRLELNQIHSYKSSYEPS